MKSPNNGGARPGAGRKPGQVTEKTRKKQLQEQMAREHMVNRFLREWDKIEETMLKLALGKTQMVEYNGKQMTVYSKGPSEKMLQTISEIVMGKPKQEVSGSMDMNMPALIESNRILREILEKK